MERNDGHLMERNGGQLNEGRVAQSSLDRAGNLMYRHLINIIPEGINHVQNVGKRICCGLS